jgi:hypothetical protein
VEILVNDELKVFLNPADYVFPKYKHFGYILADRSPDSATIHSSNIDGLDQETKQLKYAFRIN